MHDLNYYSPRVSRTQKRIKQENVNNALSYLFLYRVQLKYLIFIGVLYSSPDNVMGTFPISVNPLNPIKYHLTLLKY